ncbi:hypothetical protein T03_3384 [Trichinella britovi]|uniref:Reverse transcriptase domain-containing protein n=1 Tax=Trichinella britovi TaxID=45882 RepID=A0A0V1CEV6_TRIBR|nr:hypothetical protein T03_3384 [Trichinella britovi]
MLTSSIRRFLTAPSMVSFLPTPKTQAMFPDTLSSCWHREVDESQTTLNGMESTALCTVSDRIHLDGCRHERLSLLRFPLCLVQQKERNATQSCANDLQAFKVSGCSFLLVIKRRAWMPLKYASTQVCCGLTCSPFLAMSVTRYHALKHLQGFPLGANQVLENMYVDDIVFSVDENEEAIETVRQLMVLMKKGNFI